MGVKDVETIVAAMDVYLSIACYTSTRFVHDYTTTSCVSIVKNDYVPDKRHFSHENNVL